MKGEEQLLVKYMQGPSTRFVIPVYQRNYDWKIENCKQLFDDLEKVIKYKRKSHFFGSIVATVEGNVDERLIIDGQQRLTTVSLLMLAMCHVIDDRLSANKYSQSEEEEGKTKLLKARIYEEHLIDRFKTGANRIKLIPVKDDREALIKLFDSIDEKIPYSTVTINYEYLKERILNSQYTINEIFEAVEKLEIISISLEKDDNPQLIFESLNSTGLDLSEGDKIRNYILMGLPNEEQIKYYEKYWTKIEKNTKDNIDLFVRDFLSIKNRKAPAFKKIYPVFKEYCEDNKASRTIEELLVELTEYSKRYRILLNGCTWNTDIDNCIFRLNELETSVVRPFFLEVLRLYDEQKLKENEVLKIFNIVESYIFRRLICEVPTNALNKIFISLHREIIALDKENQFEDYVDKMIYVLTHKTESGKFPDNKEFKVSFAEKNLYKMRSKNRRYYFERLENFGTKETKDVWQHFENGDYSIEHIMPQTLSEDWMNELSKDGGNPNEIQEKWLHKPANLTLTAYNSDYSNKPFNVKRDLENGFKDSGLRMNSWIAAQDSWGLSQLEERNKILTKKALEIWEYPISSYKPKEKLESYVVLSDDLNLTGRKPKKVVFKGEEYKANNWVDIFEWVVKMLYAQDKSIILKLVASTSKSLLDSAFGNEEQDFRAARKIDEGVYLLTNNDTNVKIKILSKLLEYYGYEQDDLVFYLRDNQEIADTNLDLKADRYVRRREFWNYMLPKLKEGYTELGLFQAYSEKSLNYDNWKASQINSKGIELVCKIRYDLAQVTYYIRLTDESMRMAFFDMLLSKKSEIEKEFGDSLIWDRGDGKKRSQISYQRLGVSLNEMFTWDEIADFMIEKGCKLVKLLQPLEDEFFKYK